MPGARAMTTRRDLPTLDLWVSAAFSAPKPPVSERLVSSTPPVVSSPPPVGVPAPTPQETDSACGWADLPHELLVQIFAAQPEPLHNLSGEFVCRAWAYAVRTKCSAIATMMHLHLEKVAMPHTAMRVIATFTAQTFLSLCA